MLSIINNNCKIPLRYCFLLFILISCSFIDTANSIDSRRQINNSKQRSFRINNDNDNSNNSNNNNNNNNSAKKLNEKLIIIDHNNNSNTQYHEGVATELQNSTIVATLTGAPTNCSSCLEGYGFVENFACSDGRGQWNNGVISFMDPIPQTGTLVLKKVSLQIFGNIQTTAVGEIIYILLGGDVVSAFAPNNETAEKCANCQQSLMPVTTASFPNGCASYTYGQMNDIIFQISSPFNTTVCLSKVVITLFYGPVNYKINSLIPAIGNSSGYENITIVGQGFYSNGACLCKFGSQTSTAYFINSTTMICSTPPLNIPSDSPAVSSDYNVTVQISEDGGTTYCAPFYNFSYIAKSIPLIHPTVPGTNKWIWISLVIVGSAAFMISGLALFYWFKYKKIKKNPLMIDGSEKAPLLQSSYKTLFEIKPIDISEIVILNRIGRGSCAEVYTGTWRGITVAVKKAKLLNEDDEDFLNELAQEATIMSQLRHPNVCQFLGTCNAPPEILIVMEYMPLGSLYRILHDQSIPLDWPRMKSMALDIAKGMNYLHCCDPIVIHRDLKSHNLLVDEHFRVKISDFGLSTRFKQHLDKKTAMTPVGTPCWTAPEVLRNDTYTEKADVFSFAIVLWEIVTREDPYQGMPTFQIVISVGQHKLRPIVPPQVSAPFTRLITECWSEDPAQRPSFQDIVKRLEAM